MELKQSCNVFLSGSQYKEIKELGFRMSIPYSVLIRQGVDLILNKYKEKEKHKDGKHNTN